MEHYNFLAGLCGKCLTSSCGSFVPKGAREVSGDCLSLWHRMPAGVMVQEGKWQCGTCLFSWGMRRYCDTRLCTSTKTGTVMTSLKIVNCNGCYYFLLHKLGDIAEFVTFSMLPSFCLHLGFTFHYVTAEVLKNTYGKMKWAGMGQIWCHVLVLGVCAWWRDVVLRSGLDRGEIISFCHRCISLECLWFYTRVTQLYVFA